MICHSVEVNVETGTWNGTVQIPQGDSGSHNILIRVVDNKGPVDLKGYKPHVSFYRSSEEDCFSTEGATEIVSAHKGYISYFVGRRLSSITGRLVGEVTLVDDIKSRKLSGKFIVEVVSDARCCANHIEEVIVTKEFYEALESHMDNQFIHLTPEDSKLLDYLFENKDSFLTTDNLLDAMKDNPEIADFISESAGCTLTQSITATTDVGEVKEGTVFEKGEKMVDVLTAVLSKDKSPVKVDPSVTLSVVGEGDLTSFESGTRVTPKWVAKFNQGSYSYKSTKTKDPITPEEGTGVNSNSWWKITRDGEQVGSSPAGSANPFILGDEDSVFSASVDYTDGNYALTLLNNLPSEEVRIVAGTASASAKITTFRNIFCGGTTRPGEVDSSVIRSLIYKTPSSKTTVEFEAKVGDTKVILAFPASLTSKPPVFEYFTLAWESFPGFTNLGYIQVADARGGSNGLMKYIVYSYEPSQAFEAPTKFRAIIK